MNPTMIIFALILGLVSFLLGPLGFFLSTIGIAISVIALRRPHKDVILPGGTKGKVGNKSFIAQDFISSKHLTYLALIVNILSFIITTFSEF